MASRSPRRLLSWRHISLIRKDAARSSSSTQPPAQQQVAAQHEAADKRSPAPIYRKLHPRTEPSKQQLVLRKHRVDPPEINNSGHRQRQIGMNSSTPLQMPSLRDPTQGELAMDQYGSDFVLDESGRGAPVQERQPSRRGRPRRSGEQNETTVSPKQLENCVPFNFQGKVELLSPILLRDLCKCPACVDVSTKQKLFSTTDIPRNIRARRVEYGEADITFTWANDIVTYDKSHSTALDLETVRQLAGVSTSQNSVFSEPGLQLATDAAAYAHLEDISYNAFMSDDATLLAALEQLHTRGLLFLKEVPEEETSVSTIGERIGPLKNTFYGYTWDVRSVPQAKNVAYTSQDLGFHMDLLYMEQPPHIQLLHCIRSSSAGGASVFTDSYRAVEDLFYDSFKHFYSLARYDAHFHYKHPSSHLYQQSRPVIKTRLPKFMDPAVYWTISRMDMSNPVDPPNRADGADVIGGIDHVNWSPPFQGPMNSSLARRMRPMNYGSSAPAMSVSQKFERWHEAAQAFNQLLHRPDGVYERMMKPGECVIFDNRRVLHARRAFEVGDVGKERWLRGAYIDQDPFYSKMRVLRHQLRMAEADAVADVLV